MNGYNNNRGNYTPRGTDKFGNPQKKIALKQYINKAGEATDTFTKTIEFGGANQLLNITVNAQPSVDSKTGLPIVWVTLTKKKKMPMQARSSW